MPKYACTLDIANRESKGREMISLSHALSLAERGEAPEQQLWYEEGGEYRIFAETEAYLHKIGVTGKSYYMLALHREFYEDPVLDFFLSASCVESLQAILVALNFHKRLFKPWIYVDGVMKPLLATVEIQRFIGPTELIAPTRSTMP